MDQASPPPLPPGQAGELSPSAKDNLELLTMFKDHEDAQISGLRLLIERISAFLGSPSYFIFAVTSILLWMLVNWWVGHIGERPVDPPPFSWLQGVVSSNALLMTVAVLIRQNRMAKVAEHRAHLDLQINLLTEQKVTKILQIIDELKRERTDERTDAPTETRARPDSQVAEMTKPADAHALMHAIKEKQREP